MKLSESIPLLKFDPHMKNRIIGLFNRVSSLLFAYCHIRIDKLLEIIPSLKFGAFQTIRISGSPVCICKCYVCY